MTKKWYPYELHTHTPHSDGQHSLLEMATKAKELELKGIALTDHNTMSGLQEREHVEKVTGIHIVKGLEWTTFYGHMVTLGIEQYVDWRNLSPLDIHKGIKQVHKSGGVVGIAHPFCIGSPICTGCYWEYEITDWNDIDYIEVWSTEFPSIKRRNLRAYDLWTEKLNEGYQISATSGRDWHHSNNNDSPIAVSYLHIEESERNILDHQVVDAVKTGKISVTQGPLLLLSGKIGQQYFEIGDKVIVPKDCYNCELEIEINHSTRQGQWTLPKQLLKVVIVSNKGQIGELDFSSGEFIKTCELNVKEINWIRAELYGVFNRTRTMIAFTNPVYFKR